MSDSVASGHLSIGEVLALVQADFPDVTISKIRFLESQGLIAPERTASGYRKFYEADIDRLRWILAQQRDHFLPLKVIRKMLDQGVDVVDASQSQPSLFSAPDSEPSRPDMTEPERSSSPRSPQHPAVKSAPRRPQRASTGDSQPSGSTPVGPASGDTGSGDTGSGERASDGATPDGSTAAGSAPAGPASGAASGVDAAAAGESNSARAAAHSGGAGAVKRHSTPADVVAALQEDPRAATAARGRRAGGSSEASRPPVPKVATATRSGGLGAAADGEPMSRDELCAATGITEELLADLESYGLIDVGHLAGAATYDAESQMVARTAVRCIELGIEPRHLRMYKVAAEREAGFVEQLVMPLIKQRNPASREQAIERTDELLKMGADLHATLLRRRLGPVLGS